MNLRHVSEEVYYSRDPLGRIGREELAFLKFAASGNPRGRARICAHPSVESRRHDMFVALTSGAYSRPHRHAGKSEGVCLLDGMMLAMTFDEDGRVTARFTAAPPQTGLTDGPAFFRIPGDVYHVYVAVTPCVVFHESISGPFDPSAMIPAPWAPAEHDPATGLAYLAALGPAAQPFSQ